MLNYLWFKKNPFVFLLLPLMLIYAVLTAWRRRLYRTGFFRSYRAKVPVVVVGNIMVGGNGKTPVVIALARYLKQKGLRVAVVSRGYGSHAPLYPYEVRNDSSYQEAGDEPLLIKKSTGARVVIDPNRSRAVRSIEKEVDVVLTDDGLQHYALERDLEIVVIDGKRRFGNGFLMLMGPLREGLWRLKSVDFRICNGGTPAPFEAGMTLKPNAVVSVHDKEQVLPPGTKVAVLAGIGDPTRVYETVKSLGYELTKTIAVKDHGAVSPDALKSCQLPIIMTEKDFVKYNGNELVNAFVLPVVAEIEPSFYGVFYAKLKPLLKIKTCVI